VLDFGKPENPLWRGLYFSYLRWLLPVFGTVLCRIRRLTPTFLSPSNIYPAQRGVALKMQQLNCEDVRTINLLGGVMSINYARKAGA